MDIELQDLQENLIKQSQRKKTEEINDGKSIDDNTIKKDNDIQTPQGNRCIKLNGQKFGFDPENTNKLNNRKYTVLNFVPTVLYNQFKYFFNLFFLVLCISQFIPYFKVGLLFSYVAPLVFVLVLTMLKEAYDDYKRYIRDLETNNKVYKVWQGGIFVDKKSQDLQEGQIIELNVNDIIPADCVLLWSGDPSETVFIKTDQLDGETDWKLRNPISFTQNHITQTQQISAIQGTINYEPPHKDIYKFNGLFINDSSGQNQPLNLDHTLWNSTVLCSSKAYAIIIFIGKETRIAKNITEKREKVGSFDQELNQLSKLLFTFMLVISICLHLSSNTSEFFLVSIFKFVLLLSTIIPISLRVNLDFSKIFFTYKINNNPDIGAVVRNSQIPEELGRVGIILTDKTGTLTKNEMHFKRLSSEYIKFKDDDKIIKKYLGKELKNQSSNNITDTQNSSSLLQKNKLKKGKIVKELIMALNLCHNVTPVEEEGQRILQASSPDEIALVNAAESYGLILQNRTQREITLYWNDIQKVVSFKVLYLFPFTSERKRMGIILQEVETGKIIFYLKGADFIMKKKVPENKRGFLMDECDTLSVEGFRTLVYGFKILTTSSFQEWSKIYQKASASLTNREEEQNKALDILEEGVQFLMITGVEDKLQNNCNTTIENLTKAGIQIWILTGDKIETVSCVAISTGLKTPEVDFFYIKEIPTQQELLKQLNNFAAIQEKPILVIDGSSLALAMETNEEFFFQMAGEAYGVICCRCSPTQKAEVTRKVKQYSSKITLSIGDGGNDVPMIMEADIGVGIVGKEGKQAALASDFSLLEFQSLKELLLWHGRNSYKRGAVMAQFVIHRGLIISVMQVYFFILIDFIKMPLFNGYLLLGYSTLYTMLPVFSLIFDQDIDKQKALQYPDLYQKLQMGIELTNKSFLIWLWISIYQGFMIVMLNFFFFHTMLRDFVTLSFTALIFVQLLNSLAESHTYNIYILASIGISLLLYVFTFIFLSGYFQLSAFNFAFVFKSFMVALFSYLPIYIFKRLIKYFSPTEEEKIMKNVNIKKKSKFRKLVDKYLLCKKQDKIQKNDLI